MATKKMNAEEKFVKTHRLTETYAHAKEVDPDLWNTLQDIAKHYEGYSDFYEAIVQKEVLAILSNSGSKGIHSAYLMRDITVCII